MAPSRRRQDPTPEKKISKPALNSPIVVMVVALDDCRRPRSPSLPAKGCWGVKMVFVTAPSHAPARLSGPITQCVLAEHVQLVLTDRTDLSQGQEFKVLSPRNSRLADLGAKHAFLRAGLGWGGMPFAMVERDLADGLLVEIKLQDEQADGFIMPMFATYRTNSPPGPAGRWLIDELKACEPVDGGVGAASALTPAEDSQSGRSSRCCGHGSNRDRLPQYGLCRTAIPLLAIGTGRLSRFSQVHTVSL